MMDSYHKYHSNEVMRGNLEARMMSLYDGRGGQRKVAKGDFGTIICYFGQPWKPGNKVIKQRRGLLIFLKRIDWLSLKLKYETVKRSNGNVDCPDSPGYRIYNYLFNRKCQQEDISRSQ